MNEYKDLNNECIAIGSMPYKNVNDALNIVKNYCYNIPFCPQLPQITKNEDMIAQYTNKMPGIVFDELKETFYFDTEAINFSNELENLFITYEKTLPDMNCDKLDYYEIAEDYSKAFNPFLKLIKELKPKYAKTQITGPFTLSINLTDKNGKCAYYDKTLRDIIVKTLALKTLWQIKKIKQAYPATTPIIFIDEPMLSQLETSLYEKINQAEIIEIIKEISKVIQNNGGLSAIHCCGKCNWSKIMKIGMNIINFDAFSYAENMKYYINDLKDFLLNNGKIAWGIVPTRDKVALQKTNLQELEQKLQYAKSILTSNGIDSALIENNLLITPSCGCGSLSIELADKAIKLTKELSDKLKG